MDKKYQIFISSTYLDLIEERSMVVGTILKANHFPIGMEMFSADNNEQWKQIKTTIDSSDYYILIIKRRCGSLTKEGISYTNKEYIYAKKINIPILAFIISEDAQVKSKDTESDPNKLKKLNKFIKEVMDNNHCEFWKNADDLCTRISQALQKQFETNERIGWVKSNILSDNKKLDKINDQVIIQMKNEIDHEILRREDDIRLSYDFIDNINPKIIHSIKKQTYIDNFNREIVLDINEPDVTVSITTTIEFANVKDEIEYYIANPRFDTLEQAESYKHEIFSINRHDYLNDILSNIEFTDNRQFPYIVKNKIPLIYENSIRLVHKTSHTMPINQFFNSYQIIFPCRNFLTTIMIKHNEGGKYRIRTGTFSSFNVHTFDKYTSEMRNDDISTISISKWSLPGSGYTIVLQH